VDEDGAIADVDGGTIDILDIAAVGGAGADKAEKED
jgi:hypothetical protein